MAGRGKGQVKAPKALPTTTAWSALPLGAVGRWAATNPSLEACHEDLVVPPLPALFGSGAFEEQLDGLSQVVASLHHRAALAGDVEFRTEGSSSRAITAVNWCVLSMAWASREATARNSPPFAEKPGLPKFDRAFAADDVQSHGLAGSVGMRDGPCMTRARVDVRTMSVKERLDLISEIWVSLSSEPESLPLTGAQREELDRRLDDLEQDRAPGIPFQEVLDRIRGRSGRGRS